MNNDSPSPTQPHLCCSNTFRGCKNEKSIHQMHTTPYDWDL